ncbi:MAG: flagellar hook-length control protein FliK [Desulfamplus sp.]|nr:flagellar hook-length control protein FliK [Desulfamplus sp.]
MISLSDLTLLKADQLNKKSVLPLLKKDQIVDAKVLQLISPSKAELLIMGKKVLADTSVALAKGETIQLKVTDQGNLNIFRLVPDRANPSLSSDSNLASSTLAPGLPRLSDIALQFLSQQQPFEGFAKLAAALFPNLKSAATLQNDKPFPDKTNDKAKIPVQDKKVINPNSQSDKSDKPVTDNVALKTRSDETGKNFVEKLSATSQPDQADKAAENKTVASSVPDPADKPVSDKVLVPPQTDKPGKPLVSQAVVKNHSDQSGKAILDKAVVTLMSNQTAEKNQIANKIFGDKTDIKNLLISVALKSEKTDIDFLPHLVKKSGILLEKKLADIVKSGSLFDNPADRSSSKFFDNADTSSSWHDTSSKPDNSFKSDNTFTSDKIFTSDKTSAALSSSMASSTSSSSTSDSHASSSTLMLNPEDLVHEDIKGAVLNLIANSGGESSEDIQVFHEFVKNLENVQLLNSHLSESGKYIIPFPLFSENQFSFGQLFIDLGKKEKEGTSGKENSLLRVSIFLDMTNLGPIRADFSVLKNNITGGFQVSNEEIAIFFRKMLPELKQRLQFHDYHVHKIECRVVEPEKLAEQSIINELLKSEDHGFSIMI